MSTETLPRRDPEQCCTIMSRVLPSSLISRVLHKLRHHGLMGAIRKATQRAREELYLDVTHVWYELLLETDRPHVSLPPGLMLIRGGESDLPLLDELPNVHRWLARRRMKAGDDFW